MSKVDQSELNQAVQRCLTRCYADNEVLATLAVFLQELRHLEGWLESDIHDVEVAVLKVLNRIVDKSDEPADADGGQFFDARSAGLDAADVSDA
jgi:hypothetical protein